jgi:hypothetical protein
MPGRRTTSAETAAPGNSRQTLAVLTEATDPVRGMPVRVPDAQFTAQRTASATFSADQGAGITSPPARPSRPAGRH